MDSRWYGLKRSLRIYNAIPSLHQGWLIERSWMLPYTYTACVVSLFHIPEGTSLSINLTGHFPSLVPISTHTTQSKKYRIYLLPVICLGLNAIKSDKTIVEAVG